MYKKKWIHFFKEKTNNISMFYIKMILQLYNSKFLAYNKYKKLKKYTKVYFC